jgi:hypothetical protein
MMGNHPLSCLPQAGADMEFGDFNFETLSSKLQTQNFELRIGWVITCDELSEG